MPHECNQTKSIKLLQLQQQTLLQIMKEVERRRKKERRDSSLMWMLSDDKQTQTLSFIGTKKKKRRMMKEETIPNLGFSRPIKNQKGIDRWLLITLKRVENNQTSQKNTIKIKSHTECLSINVDSLG